MKKILLSLLVLASGVSMASAQTTLTAANMNPTLGEVFISLTCDTLGVVPGLRGSLITWDFSGLTSTTNDTGLSVTCGSTPHCSLFPGSNVAIKTWTGTTVNYNIATTTAYSQNGYYYDSTQFATFSDPLDQFHYPSVYLDSFVDYYAGTITYSVSGLPITAHQSGTAKVVCDGSGTLKLPGGIVITNVLRYHSSQLFVDSASVFGIDTVATFALNTYSWYTPNYHSPLLSILITDQINGALHNKTVTYAKRYPVGIASVNGTENTLSVFPNPATDNLNVKFTQGGNETVHIALVDLTGREVSVIANNTNQSNIDINYNTSSLPRGLYLIRVQAGNETTTRKVTLQ